MSPHYRGNPRRRLKQRYIPTPSLATQSETEEAWSQSDYEPLSSRRESIFFTNSRGPPPMLLSAPIAEY